MSRLIDADALIEEIGKIEREPYYQHEGEDWAVGLAFASGIISEAETIDAVPAVRCRECSKWKKHDETWLCKGFGYCTECIMDCPADHYCSYGERKEGAD